MKRALGIQTMNEESIEALRTVRGKSNKKIDGVPNYDMISNERY